MSTWPSILSTLTDPAPTDKLNSPSHSSIESAQNDGIEKLESFVGTLSSTAGTLIYDIRATASDGGGHVQAANKGGTGQTTYTKGDILVAQGSSALSKLAVGTDGQIFKANSSAAAGVNWADDSTPKIVVSGSILSVANTTTETSVLSATISASTLGATNAVRASLFIDSLTTNNSDNAVTIKGHYGSSSVAVTLGSISGATNADAVGGIDFLLIANAASNSQQVILKTSLGAYRVGWVSSIAGFQLSSSVISEDSGASKTLGITAKWNSAHVQNVFSTRGFTVEKIN